MDEKSLQFFVKKLPTKQLIVRKLQTPTSKKEQQCQRNSASIAYVRVTKPLNSKLNEYVTIVISSITPPYAKSQLNRNYWMLKNIKVTSDDNKRARRDLFRPIYVVDEMKYQAPVDTEAGSSYISFELAKSLED